jgi:hypothetical protein
MKSVPAGRSLYFVFQLMMNLLAYAVTPTAESSRRDSA